MFEAGFKFVQGIVENSKGGGAKLTYPSSAKGKRIKHARKGGGLAFALKVSCFGLSLFLLYVAVCLVSRMTSMISKSNHIMGGAGGTRNITVRDALKIEKDEMVRKEKKMVRKAKTLLLGKNSLYRLEGVEDAMGKMSDMALYNGMISVIVNVACKTPEYDEMWEPLFALQDKYKKDGLIVLGFPIDNFHKGPANMYDYEFQRYLRQQYMLKTDENGEVVKQPARALSHYMNIKVFALNSLTTNVVYQKLASAPDQLPEDSVNGNFNMYLVDRRGMAVRLYKPTLDPKKVMDEITKDIDALLISSPLKPNKKFDEELYKPFEYF